MDEDPDARCLQRAAGQRGLITRPQARQAGLSDEQIKKRVAKGKWETVHPGVFRIAGTPRTWEQQLLAAHLWAGKGSAISHRAAAALLGFEGFEPGIVELSSATKRPPLPGSSGLLHLVSCLDPIDVTHIQGIPVTTIIRTLVDLGAAVDEEQLNAALDQLFRKRKTSIEQLRRHLKRLGGRGRSRAGILRALLDKRERFPTESVLERKFLRLVKAGRLPRPECQVRLSFPGGRYRLDFVWKSVRLIVETEGYDAHSDPEIWENDRPRRNALTLDGWRVLHFTWRQVVYQPELVLATLRMALGLEPLSV